MFGEAESGIVLDFIGSLAAKITRESLTNDRPMLATVRETLIKCYGASCSPVDALRTRIQAMCTASLEAHRDDATWGVLPSSLMEVGGKHV